MILDSLDLAILKAFELLAGKMPTTRDFPKTTYDESIQLKVGMIDKAKKGKKIRMIDDQDELADPRIVKAFERALKRGAKVEIIASPIPVSSNLPSKMPLKLYALYLNPKASINEQMKVYDQFKTDLDEKNSLCAFLLANDEIIEKNKGSLEKRGILFYENWKDQNSVYRKALEFARIFGNFYKMKRVGDNWTYSFF